MNMGKTKSNNINFFGYFLLFFYVVFISGCAEPKIRNGILIQHPTSKINNLYIDTSHAYSQSAANLWRNVETSGFDLAISPAFEQFGVTAKVLSVDGEIKTIQKKAGDYFLIISYSNGFYGSSGTGATFALDLIDLGSNRKIWAGNIFVSGTGTVLTKNLGEVVAKNIAAAMNSSHLFSDEILSTNPAGNSESSSKTVLTQKQKEAFEKFKLLKFPKAFVIGDGGMYFYAFGHSENQEWPSARALQKCEARKILNCRVISDGNRIF
jgi:hypothetical protein